MVGRVAEICQNEESGGEDHACLIALQDPAFFILLPKRIEMS